MSKQEPVATHGQAAGPQDGASAGRSDEGWLRRNWREWVRPILVICLVLFSFRSAVADWNDVPTGSMNPSILPGDRVFVNKLAYDLKVPFTTIRIMRWSQPERGDTVVFHSPADELLLVKRVVAIAGDTIEMRNQRLHVNGRPAHYEVQERPGTREPRRVVFLEEDLWGHRHPIRLQQRSGPRGNFAPVQVPAGHVFVMGDNRDNSVDSRSFGLVDVDRILGQATHVVISVDPDAFYRPRWERFLQRLP